MNKKLILVALLAASALAKSKCITELPSRYTPLCFNNNCGTRPSTNDLPALEGFWQIGMDIRGFTWYDRSDDEELDKFNVSVIVGLPGGSTKTLKTHRDNCRS